MEIRPAKPRPVTEERPVTEARRTVTEEPPVTEERPATEARRTATEERPVTLGPPVTEESPAQPLKKRKPRDPPIEPSAALLVKMEERRSLTVRRATRASPLQASAFDPKSGLDAWAAELQKLGLDDYIPRKKNGDPLASLTKRRLIEFANKRADDPTAELATPTGAPTGSFDLPASCTEASLRKQAAALDFRGRVAMLLPPQKDLLSMKQLDSFLHDHLASCSAVPHYTLCELTPAVVKAELALAVTSLADAEVATAIERVLIAANRATQGRIFKAFRGSGVARCPHLVAFLFVNCVNSKRD
jgi:hypothetical protein